MAGSNIPEDAPSRAYRDGVEAISAKTKSQLAKFKEAARELGTDDDEKRFEERLKQIAKAPPPSKQDAK